MIARLPAGLAALCLLSAPVFAQGAKPTDPQIAHIAYTAGQLDIETANLALQKSKNKEVRDFAQDMVRDHTEVNKQALALANKLNVKPEDNDTSRGLSKQAAAKRDELSKLNVESTLIPSATNADLKSLLQTGLKIFQGHLQHAEHVAADVK